MTQLFPFSTIQFISYYPQNMPTPHAPQLVHIHDTDPYRLNAVLAPQKPDLNTRVYLAGPTLDTSTEALDREDLRMQLANSLRRMGLSPITSERDGYADTQYTDLQRIIARESNGDAEAIQKILTEIMRIMDYGYLIPQTQFMAADCDFPVSAEVMSKVHHARQLGQSVIGYRENPDPLPLRGDTIALQYFMDSNDIFVAPAHEDEEQITKAIAEHIFATVNNPDAAVNRRIPHVPPALREIITQAQKLFSQVEDLHSFKGMKEVVQNYLKMRDSNKIVRLKRSSKPRLVH